MSNSFEDSTRAEQRSPQQAANDAMVNELAKIWGDTRQGYMIAYYLRGIRNVLRGMLVVFIITAIVFFLVTQS